MNNRCSCTKSWIYNHCKFCSFYCITCNIYMNTRSNNCHKCGSVLFKWVFGKTKCYVNMIKVNCEN